jgi:hypothetical protein
MRNILAPILVGSQMLIVMPQIATGQPVPSAAPIQVAGDADTTPDRETYTQKARGDLQEWQKKLHDFSERTEAKGQKDAALARHDLDEAWTKAEAESRKLQTASSAEWENARISYEKASRELADRWHRVVGPDK